MMNAPLSFRLTPLQEKAVEMLASGCTVRYTALALGVKAVTVSGWMKRNEGFKAKLSSRRQELIAPSIGDRAS